MKPWWKRFQPWQEQHLAELRAVAPKGGGNPAMEIDHEPDLIQKLQDWVVKQPGSIAPVTKAAEAMGLPIVVIEQLARDGYWLAIEMRHGVAFVAADGE
jgi:hypothetical protein